MLLRLLLLLLSLLLLRLSLLLLLLGRSKTSLTATGHDAAEEAISGSDRWRLLRRSSMLRGARKTRLRSTSLCGLELVTEHGNLFLVSAKISHLLYEINRHHSLGLTSV